jgi:chromosome segregation ATPase
MWLARELSGVLSTSSLGIIARKDNQEVADALGRIEQLYTSNYHFLDLLRTQNQALLEASGVDAELMKLPNVRWHLTAEMDECKRLTQESQELRAHLVEANRRLGEADGAQAARQQQLEVLERSDQAARQQLAALESSNQVARQQLATLESSNQAAREQLAALESSNQAARQQLATLESSIAFKTALRVRRWRARLAPEQSVRFWCYRRLIRAVQIWRAEGIAGLLRGIARKCWRPA